VIILDNILLYFDEIIAILQQAGIIGGFLLVLLESIFPVMPLAVFIGMNCLSFGIITGSIISWLATCCGCIASFILFKTIFKDKFYTLFKKNKKLKKNVEIFMDKLKNIDFNGLVILLAIPFTPAFAVNIAAGLSDMPVRKYLFSILISKIAIVYFWGFVGNSLIESITNPEKLLEIAGIVFLAYLISKVLEKIVKVEE